MNMIKRTFITGSEWLYYKIYTGPKTADLILTDVIKPVSEKLIEDGIIDSWFFIRYADPKMHLRVRFHHTPSLRIEKTIGLMHDTLSPFIDEGLVWKIANDTYNRELERYGHSSVELAERLFFFDSVMVVGILNLIEGDEGEAIRWLIALRAVDGTLEAFGYDAVKKLSYIEKLRDGFGAEFNMEKNLKSQLSDKYRSEKKAIESVMEISKDNESEMAPLFEILKTKKTYTLSVARDLRNMETSGQLEIPVDQLMDSFLHMMVNRLFKSKQRLHELVLYDILFKFYTSQKARAEKTVQKGEIVS
jgi:thiopeptide-type bacteriocin biosynthesis protein